MERNSKREEREMDLKMERVMEKENLERKMVLKKEEEMKEIKMEKKVKIEERRTQDQQYLFRVFQKKQQMMKFKNALNHVERLSKLSTKHQKNCMDL